MQIKISRIEDGPAYVEVIDTTDGATTHRIDVNVGEQIVINAPTASSPADIEIGDVTEIPTKDAPTDPEAAEADPAEGPSVPVGGSAAGAENPTKPGTAPGDDAPGAAA